MSKSSYYPQLYGCHKCGKVQKHYVWSNEIEKTVHECTNAECKAALTVENVYEELIGEAPSIKTPTRNRVLQSSRQKRNTKHFKKEVYPTLARGSAEQKHFSRKHGLK